MGMLEDSLGWLGVSRTGVSHGAGMYVFALHLDRRSYACTDNATQLILILLDQGLVHGTLTRRNVRPAPRGPGDEAGATIGNGAGRSLDQLKLSGIACTDVAKNRHPPARCD